MRIRNIKPGFWTNEDLADCTERQNLLFIGLWMLADKNGCLEYRPRRIKGELFALRDSSVEELRGDIKELAKKGLIHLFRSTTEELPQDCDSTTEELPQTQECVEDAAEYIGVINFIKHQHLTTWEKKQSEPATPLPQYYRSTAIVLQPEVAEVGSKGDAEELKKGGAEEGRGAAATAELLRQFQECHPSCKTIGEQAFVAAIAASTTTEGPPDVAEAITAFMRHMAGVSTIKFPLREFEKYLRNSSRKQHEQKTQKKKKTASRHPALSK